jgi:2-polyprenyl-6-methoxyphenol hydroxylase-like FAD-dependent oxidoreductase
MTEKTLEKELTTRCPNCVSRGIKGFDFKADTEKVTVNFEKSSGKKECIASDFLLACDGKNSSVRESLGIRFDGKYYKDCYVMGDFRDDTRIGSKAIIFLSRDGVIESFPLPDKKRRWVIKTDHFYSAPKPKDLTDLILERTGHQVDFQSVSMTSGFRTQGLIAEKMAKGRIILAGDAAHVTSPIGGQGMNMGWLNAWRLTETFDQCLKNGQSPQSAFFQYEREAKSVAKRLIKRAEFNMFLGRKSRHQTIRRLFVHFIVDTPMRSVFASNFTMRRI